MMKFNGANDACNAIANKMDEALILAEEYLQSMRNDAAVDKSSETLTRVPSATRVTSPIGSERSCSPTQSRTSVSSLSSTRQIKVAVNTESYMSQDKKKGVILTKIESKKGMAESDVAELQEMIKDSLKKKGYRFKASSTNPYIMEL